MSAGVAAAAATAAGEGERRTRRFLWVFGILMVGVAGTGFLFKLIEFIYIATHQGADSMASFLIPVLNYLVVAAGFGCLFLWAYASGQFRDVEATKFRMLEMQDEFDREEAAGRAGRRHGR